MDLLHAVAIRAIRAIRELHEISRVNGQMHIVSLLFEEIGYCVALIYHSTWLGQLNTSQKNLLNI